jgi:hypothetical protein
MVMSSNRSIAKFISLLVCTILSLQLASCGTLLYPERRGQRSGELDVAVVLMDGIGLFFFIIPGVIAFAVDLHTGAIYLPSGRTGGKRRTSAPEGVSVVIYSGIERLTPGTLSDIVSTKTGHPIRLDDPNLMIKKADITADIAKELTRLSRFNVR